VFVPERSETSIDKILVDGADAVALARFSLVVKANGRHLSKLVVFRFTVESGYLVRLHLYEDTDLLARAVTASDRDGGQEARSRCKSLPCQGCTSS
jgi:ketosteroid isomerase-like protein